MPEEQTVFDRLRGRFDALIRRGKPNVVIDEDQDEPEPVDPRLIRFESLSRTMECQKGLLPLLQERQELLDDTMDRVSTDHGELNKVLGARDELRSLIKQLVHGGPLDDDDR